MLGRAAFKLAAAEAAWRKEESSRQRVLAELQEAHTLLARLDEREKRARAVLRQREEEARLERSREAARLECLREAGERVGTSIRLVEGLRARQNPYSLRVEDLEERRAEARGVERGLQKTKAEGEATHRVMVELAEHFGEHGKEAGRRNAAEWRMGWGSGMVTCGVCRVQVCRGRGREEE
ncbi:MAG: hypothetical protein SGPRY_014255 [Prymnesium sp.]